MTDFLYKATNKSGKFKTGVIAAATINEARVALKKQDLLVQEIKPTETGLTLDNLWERVKQWFNRITLKDKVFFTRQLSTIIAAGFPLLRALYLQEKQTRKKKFQDIIQRLIADLEGGKEFSKALAKYPEVFDDFYVSLIRAGEVSGSMDESLSRLADQLEKTQTLQFKIKSALVLPGFTFLVMIGVVVVMLVFVFPQISDLFKEEGVELPLATSVLIWLSEFLIQFWYAIVIALGITIFLLARFIRTPEGRKLYDKFVLKPPIFGPLLQKIYLERFSLNLGTMLKAGVPIIQAMQVVADTLTNVHYRQSVLDLIPQVEKGRSLSKSCSKDTNFSFLMVQMISIGEESGALDDMLLKIAKFYEEEIDVTVKNLTTLLEPFIVVIIALGVGFIGVAILGPIYGLVAVI